VVVADVVVERVHDPAKSRSKCVCRHERRVQFDRAAKQPFDLMPGLEWRERSGELTRREPSEVEVVGFRIHGRWSVGVCVARKLHAQLRGDLARHVALQRQRVAQRAVEVARPYVTIGLRIDQLQREADCTRLASHRSLEHVSRTDVFRELGDRLGIGPVAHHGRPGDDLEPRRLARERRENFLVQAFREKRVRWIGTQVREGENREPRAGDPLRGRLRATRA
jgi:hypothetical protein